MHRLGFLAVLLAAASLCVPTYYLGLQITWILGTIGYAYTLVLSLAIMVATAYVYLSTGRIVVGLVLAIVLAVLGASAASEVFRVVGLNPFLLSTGLSGDILACRQHRYPHPGTEPV